MLTKPTINLKDWLAVVKTENDPIFRDALYYYCCSFIGGIWEEAKVEEIIVEKLTGGTINNIILCSLSSSFNAIKNEPTKIVFRIYCVPERSAIAENIISNILGHHKLGPKLYGILGEARMEEYIPGRSISIEEARFPAMAKEIARNFARIHKLEIPICKFSNFMDFIDDWYANLSTNPKLPDSFQIPKSFHATAPSLLTIEMIKAEIEFIRSKFSKLNKNVVFCHNDLLGGNILLAPENPAPSEMSSTFKPKLMFIDFEFATYNPRGFDLADHFAKYAYDYSAKNPPFTDIKKLAGEKEMLQFANAYVEEMFPEMGEDEQRKEAENLLKETTAFLPISPFFWGGYMINHVLNHPSTFDAFSLALERFGIYFTQKHLLENL